MCSSDLKGWSHAFHTVKDPAYKDPTIVDEATGLTKGQKKYNSRKMLAETSYHSLSNDEKEKEYQKYSIYFELLNSHLNENDSVFLNQYIKFRFFSKAILQENPLAGAFKLGLTNNLP